MMTELVMQEMMAADQGRMEPDHDYEVEVDVLLSQFNVYKEDMRRRGAVLDKRVSDCERVVLGLVVCGLAMAAIIFGFMVSR